MSCCSSSNGPISKFLAPMLVGVMVTAVSMVGLSVASSYNESEKMLRHVVLVKFKEGSSKEEIAKVIEGFRALPSKISEVAAFEYGTDNSPEGLANGFTHCFFFSFKTEKDRDAYLPHAAHKAFVDTALPHIEKVLVVDYFAGK